MISCPRCGVVNPVGTTTCGACFAPMAAAAPSAPAPVVTNEFGFTPGPAAPDGPPAPPPRSAIPRVIGILMIIFGALGTLAGLVSLLRNESYHDVSQLGARFKALKHLYTLDNISSFVGILLGLYELFAGGRAVQYRSSAPRMATVFAIVNIATTVLFLVLIYAWLMPALRGLPGATALAGFGATFWGIISVAWSVVVLALMTRPAAKAACATGL